MQPRYRSMKSVMGSICRVCEYVELTERNGRNEEEKGKEELEEEDSANMTYLCRLDDVQHLLEGELVVFLRESREKG